MDTGYKGIKKKRSFGYGDLFVSEPNFQNLLQVLHREVPDRPTLFEFFLNEPLYEKLALPDAVPRDKDWKMWQLDPVEIYGFRNAGYDYVTCSGCDMTFTVEEVEKKETISLNAGHSITDRSSFEAHDWPDPDSYDYSRLEKAVDILPEGMKLIVHGPGGILENAISLVGLERLCIMLMDDPDLAKDIFDALGQRMVRYYEISASYDIVGALISNDDWGFKTQTTLSPKDLRRYVFPWHKRIVEIIHGAGKPAILHSCGNLEKVMDDVIDDMKYDAKHSFEDSIIPVEDAYEQWGDRIAILGGIDMDFVCRSRPEKIKERSKAVLARTAKKGGYALGTGNSVPEYVPDENFFALISAATEMRD